MSNYVQLKDDKNLQYKIYGLASEDNHDYFLLWYNNHWQYFKIENCIPVNDADEGTYLRDNLNKYTT
jgi:hypothetical protein